MFYSKNTVQPIDHKSWFTNDHKFTNTIKKLSYLKKLNFYINNKIILKYVHILYQLYTHCNCK